MSFEYWPPEEHQPLRALGEERSTPWAAIFSLLIVLIAIVGAATWLLGRNDGRATTSDDTSTSAADPDTTITDDASTSDTGGSTAQSSTTTTSTSSTTLPPEAADLGPITLDESSTVSTVGLDTVTFGMTVAAAQVAAGTVLLPDGAVGDCYLVRPAGAPEGISFIVSAGTIERVDITAGPITTRSGVGIGTPEDTVVELFGAQLERAVNADGTVDLVFVPSDPGDADYRVVFTVGSGSVQRLRSGRLPEVLRPTGCETQ